MKIIDKLNWLGQYVKKIERLVGFFVSSQIEACYH